MEHTSSTLASAGKENTRPWVTKPTAVPKTPTARVGVNNPGRTAAATTSKRAAAAGRSGGRGSALSLRADGNGGGPSSALRAKTTAAASSAVRRKRQGEEIADVSNSSGDFTGPQRVRINSNSVPADISLSFWSLPASTPDSKSGGGRLTSKTVTKGTAAGGKSASASTRKRARGGGTPQAVETTVTTAATRAEARHQASKWSSGATASTTATGSSASDPSAAAKTDRAAAAATAKVDSVPSNPFGTDISHILSWKPAPRQNAAGSDGTGGSPTTGSASTNTTPEAGSKQEQHSSTGGPSTQQPTAAATGSFGRSSASSSFMTVASSGDGSRGRTAGGVGEEAGVGAAGRPRTRAPPLKSFAKWPPARTTPTEMGTATVSARPAISSLEALRVRVVKKVGEKSDDGDDGGGGPSSDDDGDDDGDDDDSFEVDLKLEAYDAEVRRRSADAAVAPRPGAVESRSSSISAGARPPSRFRTTSAAETAPGALITATAGASHEGGSRAGGLPGTGAGPAAAAASVEEKAPSEPAVSGTSAPRGPASSVITTHDLGANGCGNRGRGFLERGGSGGGGGGGGPLWRSASGTGGARDEAGMYEVAEEDEDMSLTIGTGSGRPMVPVMTGGGAGSGGNLRGRRQGGGNAASRNGTGVAAQDPGGTAAAAAALPVCEHSPLSACVSSSSSSSSSDPRVFSAEEGGSKGDLRANVGSKWTDNSDRGGGSAGSEGLGDGGSSSSGLLGIGGRGCSFDKPGNVVAFDQSSVSHKRSWSEVMVNGVLYLKTAQIGRGGSSKVFRVVAPDCEMLALKVVKVDNHAENAKGLLDSYSNEIELLKSLQGNRFIINLENSEVDRRRGLIYIVLELGETDLDQLMRQYKANIASSRADPKALGLFPGGLDANFVRVIWQQMLKAVQAMHEQRVVHGDLKPANFVFVKGSLKLIDFGIAKAISNDTTNISRDSRVGTMNYMCPEAFEDTGNGELDPATGSQKPVIKQGRPSDIWSLGCILYQMAHGKTPFSHLGMLNKIRAITDPTHAIAFSDLEDGFLVETLRACLRRDPSERASIGGTDGLLSHPYLHPTAARDAANALAVRANALAARANARAADLEKTLETKAEERVEGVKRELSARYEEMVAAEVTKAVAAEQAKQMAGLSIAKSALKHIIANTVRVLHAEKYSGGSSLDRANLDRITGLVIDLGRGGGGGIQATGTRQ
ncbi:unnamed protein product [Ectocarpus sp. CCAP 1310/34]|nr:unnamed protein product [Ectocarpus sp. CCAP 1310/34]